MKIKSLIIDLCLYMIVVVSITCLIRPTILDKINQQEELNRKNTEQITTKTISLLSGSGEVIKSSQIKFPQVGEAYALIHNDERGFSKDLYFGDTPTILDIAIGQYDKSGIPGQNKPILLAGHNGTHFNLLPNFEQGDHVQIDTSYGSYLYEVYHTEIVYVDDFDTTVLDQDEEILIMYTCYPFNIVETNQRYFVYAKKVAGPLIEEVGTWSE